MTSGSNLMQQGDPLVQKLNAEIKRKDAEIDRLNDELLYGSEAHEAKSVLIRELVAALHLAVWGDDEMHRGEAALAKAKAAGYEP